MTEASELRTGKEQVVGIGAAAIGLDVQKQLIAEALPTVYGELAKPLQITITQHPYKLEIVRMLCYNVNMQKIKTAKQMERHLKGVANHYRIEILLLIAGHDRMTLEDIIREIGANKKTIGEHTRRLFLAGLINKKYRGRFMEHTLSPYGKTFVRFLESFRKI